MRTRPINAGQLRAFEAVARHLNVRAAAEEVALRQSSVSRLIQALDDDGFSLFLRHARAVELASAGALLLAAGAQALPRIEGAVRQIRQKDGRKRLSHPTFASLASLWRTPRLGPAGASATEPAPRPWPRPRAATGAASALVPSPRCTTR